MDGLRNSQDNAGNILDMRRFGGRSYSGCNI